MDGSVVRVEVPPDARFLQLVRVATAAAGALVVDEVPLLDDLRVAVDELAVTAVHSDPGGPLRLSIMLTGDGVVVDGRAPAVRTPSQLSDLGAVLLSGICEWYWIRRDGDDLCFRCFLAR